MPKSNVKKRTSPSIPFYPPPRPLSTINRDWTPNLLAASIEAVNDNIRIYSILIYCFICSPSGIVLLRTRDQTRRKYRVPSVEVFTPSTISKKTKIDGEGDPTIGELARLYACIDTGAIEFPEGRVVGCTHVLHEKYWMGVVGVRFDVGDVLSKQHIYSSVRVATEKLLSDMEEEAFEGPKLKRGLLALFK